MLSCRQHDGQCRGLVWTDHRGPSDSGLAAAWLTLYVLGEASLVVTFWPVKEVQSPPLSLCMMSEKTAVPPGLRTRCTSAMRALWSMAWQNASWLHTMSNWSVHFCGRGSAKQRRLTVARTTAQSRAGGMWLWRWCIQKYAEKCKYAYDVMHESPSSGTNHVWQT